MAGAGNAVSLIQSGIGGVGERQNVPLFVLKVLDVSQDWLLRGLTKDDRDLLCAHFHGLPPGLRYQRFGHLYPDLALDQLVANFDFASDLFCGVLSPRRELVALVQAAPDADCCFELAFSVLPAWQLNGFAHSLGERICRMLAARGAALVRIRCFRNNEAMVGLAERMGFSLAEEGVMVRGELTLKCPGIRADFSRLGVSAEP